MLDDFATSSPQPERRVAAILAAIRHVHAREKLVLARLRVTRLFELSQLYPASLSPDLWQKVLRMVHDCAPRHI